MASRPVFSERHRRLHKLRNLVQSLLLVGGMLAILGATAFVLSGWTGVAWAILAGAVFVLTTPSVAPEWVMRLYGAAPLAPQQFPEGYALLRELTRRAGLASMPRLYLIPSAMMNAFAVGRPGQAAIGFTDGMLRRLDRREFAGVLAHELAHVRNGDLWIMGLADLLSRLTSLMSWAGQLLLLFQLPMALAGEVLVPWPVLPLLIFAPTIVSLLQLALSRAREYDADTDAAGLTGDPRGLASALAKLERQQGAYWEEIVLPGRRMPQPSLLRTHPPTEERIARLLALYEHERLPEPEPALLFEPYWGDPVRRAPRMRWTGAWY